MSTKRISLETLSAMITDLKGFSIRPMISRSTGKRTDAKGDVLTPAGWPGGTTAVFGTQCVAPSIDASATDGLTVYVANRRIEKGGVVLIRSTYYGSGLKAGSDLRTTLLSHAPSAGGIEGIGIVSDEIKAETSATKAATAADKTAESAGEALVFCKGDVPETVALLVSQGLPEPVATYYVTVAAAALKAEQDKALKIEELKAAHAAPADLMGYLLMALAVACIL